MRRAILVTLLTIALSVLGGCVVGPKYSRPEPLPAQSVPAAYSETVVTNGATNTVEWKIAQPSANLSRGEWWQIFNDSELNRLEALSSTNNQELALAVARFDQSRALVRVARSDLFPHLNAEPAVTRQRTSANSFDRGSPAGVSHTYNSYTIPLTAEWELDLWGRVRQQVSAARARLAATEDDLQGVRLSIQAEVATDYFALGALNSEYAIVQQSIEAFRRSFELTENRRKGGIASDLDVSQAQTQLKAAEALLPAIDLQRAKVRNALALLCGQAATGFIVAPTQPSSVPEIAAGVPSELLERRPDIASAERRMAGANANVGVAQTAFYPRVVFHGLAGFQSIDAGTLFDWPSRVWALGPSIQLPLFTGGRNRAELAFSRASYTATVAEYRQAVLTAFQEVEDQLAAQRLLAAQYVAEEAALNAARRTLEIAQNRYKAGLVTFLEVAVSQSAALDRERNLVQLTAERLAARVALVKSLGGGGTQRNSDQASAR